MPIPKDNESEADFVARYMSSDESQKSFPDEKQRLAVAYSTYREHKKKKTKSTDSKDFPTSLKVSEKEGEVYVEGFIMTTHLDRRGLKDKYKQMYSKEACQNAVDIINSGSVVGTTVGNPRMVGLGHDWIFAGDTTIKPIGIAVEGSAQLRETGDGHWGAWVTTHLNKTNDKFDEVLYGVKHGYIPGHSVEVKDGETYLTQYNGETIEIVRSLEDFAGYSFIEGRSMANPHALIEKVSYKQIFNDMKEVKMADEIKEKSASVQETPATEPITVKATEQPPVVDAKATFDSIAVKEMIKDAVSKGIGEIRIKTKPLHNEGEAMDIKIKEMNDAISKNDILSFNEMARGLIDQNLSTMQGVYNFKSDLNVKCDGKGMRIIGGLKVKGTLDTATNPSTYTQAGVEFADLFAPGIIDTFNNQTNYFGFLKKEQHLGGTHYQWKMITNRDPNSNLTFVDRDDVTVLKQYSGKGNYQTPIKLARRGVSVTDFTIRYSAVSLGDLFQLEVGVQMNYMMQVVDASLFAEMADGTGNDPLGLEAVADSAGNTTLYGLTRSTANRLSPESAVHTYTSMSASLTEGVLRYYLDRLEIAGTPRNKVAIVCHPTIRSYLYNLLDGQRQFLTTEAQFGFTRMGIPHYDGTPIIVDHNCEATSMFVIDTDNDVIVMAMEPRLVSLAKVGAATEGYLEMHFAHVYKEPRKIAQLKAITGPVT